MTFGSKQFGLVKEGGDELGAAPAPADALERLAGGVAELPDSFGAEVGEFVLLPVSPELLDGVEFGGIGGQALDVQPRVLFLDKGGDEAAAMEGRAVPKQQYVAGHLPVQRPQETDDLGAPDRTGMQLEVEVAPCQPGDRRNTFPIEVEGEHRGLTTWRPRAGPMRPLAQSAVIEENEGAALPAGFFLRRGQSRAFQSAIFASLRSRARPTVRCGLNPIWCKSRQTWTELYCRRQRCQMSWRTRGTVHRSVAQPAAFGPASNAVRSLARTGSLSPGFRPWRRTFASSGERSRAQRLTDWRDVCKRRATSACAAPSSKSRRASSRLCFSFSPSSFCPFGMPMPKARQQDRSLSLL